MHLPILLTRVDHVTVLVLFHVVMKYLLVTAVFVYEKKSKQTYNHEKEALNGFALTQNIMLFIKNTKSVLLYCKASAV